MRQSPGSRSSGVSRSGAVLNPHYQLMELHGSEYWTYTLPRRVGAQKAAELTPGTRRGPRAFGGCLGRHGPPENRNTPAERQT
jgi:hypothetical protein